MGEIDRSLPIPVYYQLKILILKQIEQGKLQPGDKVPTEEELCNEYDISRTPVRQALLELVSDGMLTRRAGMGTFVAAKEGSKVVLRVVVSDKRWQWPLEEAARLLNQENEFNKLELDFTTVPLDELHNQLSTDVAHGHASDISVLDSVWVAEFAHREYLLPLRELDQEWVNEIETDLYPSLLTANSYMGELYAVPTNADTTLIWYRRDLLSKEGIAPPATWEDVLQIGRHFRQPEIRDHYQLGPFPLTFVGGQAGGETMTYQLLPFFWSMGGDIFSDGKVVINSAANRRALEFLNALVFSEKLAALDVTKLPWDGAMRAFADGKAVLSLGGSYENYLIRSVTKWNMEDFLERVGFVKYPSSPDGSPTTLVGGMTYGIYSQSKYPNQAAALLKRVFTPQILKPFCLQTSHNFSHKSVARAVGPEDGFLGRTAFLLEQARSRPSLPTYNQVSIEFQKMIELCLTGQCKAEEALARASERISAITGLPNG